MNKPTDLIKVVFVFQSTDWSLHSRVKLRVFLPFPHGLPHLLLFAYHNYYVFFSNFFLIDGHDRPANCFFNKVEDGKLFLLIFINGVIIIFTFILIRSVEVSQEIKEAGGFLFLTLWGMINNYGWHEPAHVYLRVPNVSPSFLGRICILPFYSTEEKVEIGTHILSTFEL